LNGQSVCEDALRLNVESFYGFVRRLISGFDGSGLDYAFTGALATSFYGVPRATIDIDVMVAVSSQPLM
jgi:hypothetical protein